MYESKLKKYEIAGAVIIFAAAVFLHFSYKITNGNILSILFGSVNESVWENIKNFMMPFVVWGAIELFCVKPPFKQFVVAKVTALYFLIAANIVLFYIYTFFTGGPIVAVDITISVVSLVLAQYFSYKITTSETDVSSYFTIAALLLLLFLAMYFTFTAFPPKIDLFRDNNTGTFGVPVNGLLPESVFSHKKY